MNDEHPSTTEQPEPTSSIDLTKQPPPGAAAEAIASGSEDSNSAEVEDDGSGLPAGAPDGLRRAAEKPLPDAEPGSPQAKDNAEDEKGALHFMLSDPHAQPFFVDAMVDTPEGLRKLRFHMKQLDGSRIEALEAEHSEGAGPFAKVDRQSLNSAKIAEAVVKMVDTEGKETTPEDPAFIGAKLAPIYAFEAMFKYQSGVAEALSAEIDRMAGMTPGRVGVAERELTNAVGNS